MNFRSYQFNLIQSVSVNYWQDIVEPSFFDKLKLIDWQAIFVSLFQSDKNYNLSLMQALFAIQQYGLFLFLVKKYPRIKMVPNQKIDTILHAYLSNITQFQKDCQNLFSIELKHIPEFGIGGEAERLEWQLAFAQTQKLFELNFGQDTMGISTAACCEILLVFT